jgi:hypothetical protein
MRCSHPSGQTWRSAVALQTANYPKRLSLSWGVHLKDYQQAYHSIQIEIAGTKAMEESYAIIIVCCELFDSRGGVLQGKVSHGFREAVA